MRHLSILFFLLGPFLLKGQARLSIPIEIENPNEIVVFFNDSLIQTYAIDFNGDKKLDYIVKTKSKEKQEFIYATEYWFNSDYSLFKKVDLYNLDYDFKFFVNLDNDSVPEIIRASGYSDGINYYITKQNLETKNESILFYFNPIIKGIENNKLTYYWGYAWTLKSILLSINGETKILCSLNHTIKNDGEIYHPENQIQFPAIFFSGEPKSSYEYSEKISQTEWLTIEEIINRIRK